MVYTFLMWWEPFTFQDGQWYLWRLSGAEIFIRRKEKTWQGFCKGLRWGQRDTVCMEPVQEDPETSENVQTNVFNRRTAALRPYLPGKPFLISLGGLKLFPGMKTTLNLEIPPLLRLVAEKSGSTPKHIFCFTPFTLKETWYGKNSMEGFLCTSLPVNTGGPCDLSVCCSVQIRNRTKNVLELDTIPFYASGLSIYEKNGKLTSDAPLIDALEDNFYMTIDNSRHEQCTLLAHGDKNDPNIIQWGSSVLSGLGEGFRQKTRIIKNLAGS